MIFLVKWYKLGDVAEWRGRGLQNLVRRFNPVRHLQINKTSRYGGIGRHEGLKIPWEQSRVGSSPTTGTSKFLKTGRSSVGSERVVWDHEVAGSSPVAPTSLEKHLAVFFCYNLRVRNYGL